MKRFILALCLMLPSPVHAAISCTNVTAANSATPTNPKTVSYLTPAGSDQVLLVFTGNRRVISPNINTPTHAGTATTPIDAEAFLSPVATKLFYRVGPAGGTNNVVQGYVGTPLADAMVIFTCSGVDTSSPIRASNTATGTGTTASVTVAGVQSGDVVLSFMVADVVTSTPTIGANQTSLNRGSDGAELAWAASQQAGSDGGVMSETIAISEQWSISAVAIKPLTVSTSHIRRHTNIVEVN